MTTSRSEIAERVAGIVGSDRWSTDHDTPKVHVAPVAWGGALEALKEV